ncbi:MAG: hypothetical protein ACYSTI_12365 [Planctomycetota bacterium]|jgi:hypothetical protein
MTHSNSWWQVKGRGIKNRKAIKGAFSVHEFTLLEFGLVVTDCDIEAIESLLSDVRHFGSTLEQQLSGVVHYYVTALVKLLKEKRGFHVEWDVEGCRDFEDYVEIARKKLEITEQIKKEVQHETEHKRTDNKKPDFGGVNTELLQFETDSPSGLETQGIAVR